MINAQVAFTLEVDDPESAVEEILEQLDLTQLKTHTIGLVGCLPSCLESGVVEALQDALPFDLVGQTSIATSSPQEDDLNQLSLMVLSGDEVEFSLSLSAPISKEEDAALLAEAYNEASSGHTEKPSFILTYSPLLLTLSGDFFVNATEAASGGVPLFGGLAVDDTMDYHTSQVIYKGKGYFDQAAYVLVYGNLHPRFYLAGITGNKLINETGVVTEAEGCQLKSINGAPVPEFLKDKGLTPNEKGEFIGINTFPYIVDYNDGSDPVIRAMFAITPEGYAVCGGDIPVGATLGVSYFDGNEIKESSRDKIEAIAADIKANGAQAVLAFSCIGRFFNLSLSNDAEALLLQEILNDCGVPYTFTYTAGEICPVASKGDATALTNRAHNSTFVALVL